MARLARIPSKWLREQAEAGTIPHLNAAGQLLFNPEIVNQYLVSLASARKAEGAVAVRD
ncbi:MAG TPA: hypothetical protein VH370_20460 [Humisphaera sp.]|nr:hypothetical protein [Humisphaera sp.]